MSRNRSLRKGSYFKEFRRIEDRRWSAVRELVLSLRDYTLFVLVEAV
jgi:hypothetical protein